MFFCAELISPPRRDLICLIALFLFADLGVGENKACYLLFFCQIGQQVGEGEVLSQGERNRAHWDLFG